MPDTLDILPEPVVVDVRAKILIRACHRKIRTHFLSKLCQDPGARCRAHILYRRFYDLLPSQYSHQYAQISVYTASSCTVAISSSKFVGGDTSPVSVLSISICVVVSAGTVAESTATVFDDVPVVCDK